MEGKKYDGGKPSMSNVAGKTLMSIAEVFDFGAGKYGKHNYRLGMKWSRYYDACMRHITSWFDGEDNDVGETGLNHIDHAICSLIMLRTNIHEEVGEDDRYVQKKETPVPDDIEVWTVAKPDDIEIGMRVARVDEEVISYIGKVTSLTMHKFSDRHLVFGKCGKDNFILATGDTDIVMSTDDYIATKDPGPIPGIENWAVATPDNIEIGMIIGYVKKGVISDVGKVTKITRREKDIVAVECDIDDTRHGAPFTLGKYDTDILYKV